MTTDKKIEFYTLADAYKKTGNPRFLAKMRKIIQHDDRLAGRQECIRERNYHRNKELSDSLSAVHRWTNQGGEI